MYREAVKGIALALTLLAAMTAEAQVKVAVIDSGYNEVPNGVLCDTGHYDFTANKAEAGADDLGHGSKVAEIIAKDNVQNYCLMIYKVFYKGKDKLSKYKEGSVGQAIRKAYLAKANIINMSIGGADYNIEEYSAMWIAGQYGIKINVAAGNEGSNLDDKCEHYPACYQHINNLTVVGSTSDSSNYGKQVDAYEDDCYGGFCGTSASTAILTHYWVVRNSKLKKK